MSLAVIFAIERRLGIHGEEKIWLPWEGCYQQVHDIERPSIEEYRKQDGGHVNGVSDQYPENIARRLEANIHR